MSHSVMVAEIMYKDKVTVKRANVKITKPNGATGFTTQTVYNLIRCQLYKKASMNASQEELNNLNYEAKIIMEPSYTIQAGDIMEVTTIAGTVEKFNAGVPLFFADHIEVPVMRREEA